MSEHRFPEPEYHCDRCPRLQAFLQDLRAKEPDWFNGPVPTFGKFDAELLIVGLAPGMKGANRTGRPFTGDYAGDLLYETLARNGLSNDKYNQHAADGLALNNCAITNAVRCLPPQNKPTGGEATTCRSFLSETLEAMPNLKVIIALGKIAHDNVVRALGLRLANYKFGHNTDFTIERGGRELHLVSSYHCSRYNTNTGRLTAEMFQDVFETAKSRLSA